MDTPWIERRKKEWAEPREKRKKPRELRAQRSNVERRSTPPVQKVPRLITMATRQIEALENNLEKARIHAIEADQDYAALVVGLKDRSEKFQEIVRRKNKALMFAAEMLIDCAKGDPGLSAAMMRKTADELRKEAAVMGR